MELARLNFSEIQLGVVSFVSRVPAGLLSPGLYYTFRVVVTPYSCMNCASSTSAVTLLVNSPPGGITGGELVVEPSVGFGSLNGSGTLFTLSAPGWVDANNPLTYTFQFVDSVFGTLPLDVLSPFLSTDTFLPVGDPYQDYALTIQLIVTDTLGGSAVLTTRVTVYPIEVVETVSSLSWVSQYLQDAREANSVNRYVSAMAVVGVSMRRLLDNNAQSDLIEFIVSDSLTNYDSFNADISFTLNGYTVPMGGALCSVFGGSDFVQDGDENSLLQLSRLLSSMRNALNSDVNLVSEESAVSVESCAVIITNGTNNMDGTTRRLSKLQRKLQSSSTQQFLIDIVNDVLWDIQYLFASVILLPGENRSTIYDHFRSVIIVGRYEHWPGYEMSMVTTESEQELGWKLNANFSSLDSLGLTAQMDQFWMISMVLLASDVSYDCTLDLTCEAAAVSWSNRYEIIIKNDNVEVTMNGDKPTLLYSTTTKLPNADSLVTNYVEQSMGTCSNGRFLCTADQTHGPPYSANETCSDYTLTCPLYNDVFVCGDVMGKEGGSCTYNNALSTATEIVCQCPVNASTVNTDRWLAANSYHIFSVEFSTIIATVQSMPSALSGIATPASDTSIDVVAISIAVPLAVCCCCLLIILAIILYRRRQQQLMEDKYGKDQGYTIADFDDLLEKGRTLRELGNFDDAETVLRSAIALVEGPEGDEIPAVKAAAAYYELALVLSALGRHIDALPYLQLAHGPFKGRYGGDDSKGQSDLQILSDNMDDEQSRDASNSTGSNLDIQPLDASLIDVVLDTEAGREDTASTIESQSTDHGYDEFYDTLTLANVKVNLPLRISKSTRSYLGPDGVAVSAGTRLEGGYENDVSAAHSTML
jgi:tetratricopeptide (TPR) repeat protein